MTNPLYVVLAYILSPLLRDGQRREVVASLIEEYKACESPNYINWGMGGGAASAEASGAAAAAQGGKEAT